MVTLQNGWTVTYVEKPEKYKELERRCGALSKRGMVLCPTDKLLAAYSPKMLTVEAWLHKIAMNLTFYPVITYVMSDYALLCHQLANEVARQQRKYHTKTEGSVIKLTLV